MTTRDADAAVVVELRDVTARIETTTVLTGISLELRKGAHLGIVGDNGSGKSTLLKLIGGLHWPAPGSGSRRYFFDGGVQRDAVLARKRITLVGPELQDAYLRLGWNFTALDVVITGLQRTEIPRLHTTDTHRAQALTLLMQLQAEHLAERSFFELSRGEQRRVLLARALAFNPAILLLDEPGSGLDVAARAELDNAISAAAQNATIVATAHTTTTLPSIVSTIVEVRDGSLATAQQRERAVPQAAGTRLHGVDGADMSARGTTRAEMGAVANSAAKSNGKPLIDIRNADVWLGDRRVLQQLSWQLLTGDNWLVTGANGAGKSTFVRLLHGQLRPALGGSIDWPGFGSPRNIWQLRRHIGWVSPELQAGYRFPTTVEQCVASGFRSSVGQTAALTEAQTARRDALLRAFELESLRKRPLRKLSYGQARRALLARTLASQPKLVLLDEPWEGLDEATIDLVVRELKAAMEHGMQVVCASHIGDAGLGLAQKMQIAAGLIRVGDAA